MLLSHHGDVHIFIHALAYTTKDWHCIQARLVFCSCLDMFRRSHAPAEARTRQRRRAHLIQR